MYYILTRMKRSRDVIVESDARIIQTNQSIFYDCTYPGCKVRAHNQHNLNKHALSHIEKDKKKENLKKENMNVEKN